MRDDEVLFLGMLGHDSDDVRRADSELSVAWLRVHADVLRALDRTGRLSAHLLDHAHVLEDAAVGGRDE